MRGRLAAILLPIVAATSLAEAGVDGARVRAARDGARRGDASAILEATRDHYRAMASFEADGDSTLRMAMLGTDQAAVSKFSMRLGRPHRFRITWTASHPGGFGHTGAAWNAGAGAYNYSNRPATYVAARTDEAALAAATGVSQGIAADVPALFFEGKGLVGSLHAPDLEGTEAVDGEPCWKISGPSQQYEHVTVWISRKRLVVRKVEHSMALSAEGRAGIDQATSMDEEQLAEQLRAAGAKDTPEMRARMKAILEISKVAMKHVGAMNGTMTHVYRQVRIGARFDDAAFEFAVPAGTPLRESMLDAVFTPSPHTPSAATEARPEDAAKARALLDRVVARYRGLTSYVADGEIVRRGGPHDTDVLERAEFSLALARPDRYRIVWWSEGRPRADGASGAVWNAGEGAYQYGRQHAAYTRHRGDESAFAIAAGVSNGLTRGLPPLFFEEDGWLTELRDPVIEGTEVVDGETCQVVSGSSRASAKHTLWIGPDLLVRRHRRLTRQLPEDARERAQWLEHSADEMKRSATPDAKPWVEMMADFQKLAGTLPIASEGDTTESYRNVRVDVPVDRADVVFDVPAGTPLKASLTADLFGE
jgi:hypothetical protein